MPIRNPFARRQGAVVIGSNQDENVRPGSSSAGGQVLDPAHPGFERVDTVGSKASSALSIGSRKSQDTGEYKMSGSLTTAVVNDSGIYLPPSPVEREATWPRRYLSRASSDTKSSSGEIEHFSISRESFDSYRRSFDICAKSPIVVTDLMPRQSLDSSRFSRLPRSSLHERRFERAPPTPEESFEDVGLNDDNKQQQHPQSKKRNFFSKFGSDTAATATTTTTTTTTTPDVPVATGGGNMQAMSRFLPGRKRAQSGQGAELEAMPIAADRPPTPDSALQEQEVEA
ncbi:hypothetical protein B0T17DRAFT_593255 [Bombardia bombarda]|uniref:Uncharacterized protein n=1 Tax=Bombardia bombarda TaxID=252184 RepID=A0AA39U015_9PEZI|nr:hypothetical protein B0T17DRAFT_593255 [Bombardia bombarda]